MTPRLNLRNPGVTMALGLFALVAGAAAYFLASAPRTPDVFSGHVYALRLRPLGVVYLTDVQHDLLAIGFCGALAALLVGVGLPGVMARKRR